MPMHWWRASVIAIAMAASAFAGARAQPALVASPKARPVRTTVAENGLVANLYTPPDANGALPAVIVLGGGDGGLGKMPAWEAWSLATRGFVALQVSYFNGPGQSHQLALIPLEYFKTAIDWLQRQPMVDPARLGIMGTTFGGEAALVIAAHYPEIRTVVAAMPSSVVWSGIDYTKTPPSTFTLAGQPLPFLPYVTEGRSISIYDLYAKGLVALDRHPDAIIPVENINGPVMLVCGEQDRQWPSCDMSAQIVTRLTAKAFKFDVQLLAYADAGDYAFGPPLGADAASFVNEGGLGGLGGNEAGNAAARSDSWPRAIAFLEAVLKQPAR